MAFKKIILTNGKTIDAFYQPADLTILNNFRGNYNVKTTNYNSWEVLKLKIT